MKFSAKLLLTACLLSTMLTATSEAGKFSNFSKNLSGNRSTSSKQSFQQSSNKPNTSRSLKYFSGKSSTSNVTSNSNLVKKNFSGNSTLLNNSRFKTAPKQTTTTTNQFNLGRYAKESQGQKMTIMPVNPKGSTPGRNPFQGGQTFTGKAPIKNLPPATGGNLIGVKNPIRGELPVNKPGKTIGGIKFPGDQLRNPGIVNSGDPDAGNPVKPRNPNLGVEGETAQAAALPTNGLPVNERPDIADRLSPIDTDRLPGNDQNSGSGQLGEGDVVASNGTVVDQEFVDLMNQWNEDGTYGGPETFLGVGQNAPWDNPEDPFWDQERPEDWKGFWPGGTEQPGVELPPGIELPPPGEMGPPDYELPPEAETPPPPYCPPGEVPPPYCPPGNCPPPYCPPPICLPPIVHCPPVCTPCVTSVCRQVVVVEQPVVEEVVEETVAPVLQLMVGNPTSLQAEGLGMQQGAVAIEVGGIGLPAPVKSWSDKLLNIDVPFIGLNGPTPATLHLFAANGQPIASIPVELIPMVETEVAAE